MDAKELSNNPLIDRNWNAYYQVISGRPPRKTLLKALSLLELEKSTNKVPFAIDLGCGEGRDTVELLRRGYNVLAVDAEPKAIERLLNRSDIDKTSLQTQVIQFERLQFPAEIDLINASFSLPFCQASDFPNLWQKIIAALRSGGLFSGHLFGDRDSWTIYPNFTFYTRSQVEELLSSLSIKMLEEEEELGQTPLGEERNWHIFHIVARKI
jgi:SAM-dependent methyltransferase